MKRVLVLFLLCLSAFGFSQETYLGLYLMGNKLGYSSFSSQEEPFEGQPSRRSDTATVIRAGLLGTAMEMKISSTSWFAKDGKPLRMKFMIESAGRTQITDARFKGSEIVISTDNSGEKGEQKLKIPTDGPIVEDPILPMLEGGPAKGKSQVFYILDPMTVTLIKNTATYKGQSQVTVKGQSLHAELIEIDDPRAATRVFVNSKGDMIKAEGPMGIEMVPESREEALGTSSLKYEPSTDLAFATSLKTDKPIRDSKSLKRVVLKVTGRDLSSIPSDEHQSVKRDGDAWIVDVHPPTNNAKGATTIIAASKQKPDWIEPSTHIPSDDQEIKALARKIVGTRTNVLEAARAIQQFVNKEMKPNAGIGVLRNAKEVLRTKEGVCRDYAILTATLMRGANIPTRLASGLVNWDGTFFYHAWVEVWDGSKWIGIDSTTDDVQITPTHVKLSQGHVGEAFTFSFLDKVKIEVLDTQRK